MTLEIFKAESESTTFSCGHTTTKERNDIVLALHLFDRFYCLH